MRYILKSEHENKYIHYLEKRYDEKRVKQFLDN